MLKKIRDVVLILAGLCVIWLILNIRYCAKRSTEVLRQRPSKTREEIIRESDRQAQKMVEDTIKDMEIREKIRKEQGRK